MAEWNKTSYLLKSSILMYWKIWLNSYFYRNGLIIGIWVDLWIGNAMFSSLLLHRECCTSKSGEQIRSGLAELELWCTEATEEVHYICPFTTFLCIFKSLTLREQWFNSYLSINYFCCSMLALLWMNSNIQSKQLDSWYAYYYFYVKEG